MGGRRIEQLVTRVSEREFGTQDRYEKGAEINSVSVPPAVTSPTPRRGFSPLRNGSITKEKKIILMLLFAFLY